MNNPGVYTLGDKTITGSVSGEVITNNGDGDLFVDGLEGMLAAGVEVKFGYGSGGTSGKVYVQTSLNQGTTWCDVICMTFGLASKEAVYNLSGLTPKTTPITPTDGALADDTCVDGVIGERWRVKVSTLGTYAGGTILGVRLMAR